MIAPIQTADFAIIGAGIVGVACAYELSLRGAGKVVLFDKSIPGSGTTSGSGGVICTHDLSPLYAQMSLLGFERVKQLRDEHGLTFRQWGRLELVRHPDGPSAVPTAYERRFGGLIEDIYTRESLGREEVKARFPWLHVPGVSGAVYRPNQGFVDTYELLSLYQRLTADTGTVEIWPNTPLLQVRRNADRVTSLVTRRGEWHVGAVINAAGPWGRKVARLAGSDLPLNPERVQVCIATAFDDGERGPHVTGTDIHVEGESIWARGEVGGTMLFAEHRDATSARQGTDPDRVDHVPDDGFATAVDDAARAVFGLERSVFLNGWACVYGTTDDGHPLIGRDRSVTNLYHVVGCNGHGMTCHVGFAIAAAATALDGAGSVDLEPYVGKPERMDVASLAVDRFDRNQPLPLDLAEDQK